MLHTSKKSAIYSVIDIIFESEPAVHHAHTADLSHCYIEASPLAALRGLVFAGYAVAVTVESAAVAGAPGVQRRGTSGLSLGATGVVGRCGRFFLTACPSSEWGSATAYVPLRPSTTGG